MPPKNKISFSKIFFSLFLFGLLFAAAPAAVRAESYNVTGYAWSSNIGWIKFNHGKSDPVKYDNSTGKLSGYAWSSNIGWIKFGDSIASYGGVGGTTAKANTSTGVVSGWARTCAGTVSGTCATMEPRTDGWDGWIKFDHNKSKPVKIDLNSSNSTYGEFTGYAWGSDVVGWISFNCSNTNTCGTSDYKVVVSLPGVTCSSCVSNPPVTGGVCGNSTVESGETCDDGNTTGGDGCSSSCQTESSGGSVCGNSTVESGETCDDGNTTGGDGCSSSCQTESSGGIDDYTLTINITGSGSGTVSDKNGVTLCHESAGESCSSSYDKGTVLDVLSASGDTGYGFGSWGGDCTIYGNNCSVTLDDNKTISASFNTNSGSYSNDPCTSNCGGDGDGDGGDGDGDSSSSAPVGGASSSSSSRPSVIIQEI